MAIVPVGIDLGKNFFAMHSVDELVQTNTLTRAVTEFTLRPTALRSVTWRYTIQLRGVRYFKV
jgi:hypothetical protein